MISIVLYEPEIAPNTGNVIRLCGNLGATLHLIHPLGFELSEKGLRRAGLDYHDLVQVHEHSNFESYVRTCSPMRCIALSTKAQNSHATFQFKENDHLLFGPETRGLPEHLLKQLTALRIPMHKHSRSLNLSNAVAVVAYEAWRQLNFLGAT